MKYNETIKTIGDHTFVFITRGKSYKFSETEIAEWMERKMPKFIATSSDDDVVKSIINTGVFKVNDASRAMFIKDLRQMGVSFCAKKYGCTNDEVTSEITRLAPFINGGNFKS